MGMEIKENIVEKEENTGNQADILITKPLRRWLWKEKLCQSEKVRISLSQTNPGFYVSAVQVH